MLTTGLKLLKELVIRTKGKTALELAKLLEVHKSNTYRYLNALLDSGYIQSGGDGRYHLGSKILELGSQMWWRMPLRETAHSFPIKLRAKTQKIVHLCILDGCEVPYIDKLESQGFPNIFCIGSCSSTYYTGIVNQQACLARYYGVGP